MDLSTLEKPSAGIPVAMFVAALTVLLEYLAIYGIARQGDAGATAHTWRLLLAGQLPIIGYFTIRSLPQAPQRAAHQLHC
jgi:hypothetical protein